MSESVAKRLRCRAILIEISVSAGVALFFDRFLHSVEAAYVVMGVGILLALAAYFLSEEIVQTGKALSDHYHFAHGINLALTQIKNPEYQTKAYESLAAVMKSINLLKDGFIPLEEREFYSEATRELEQTRHRVKAIDPLVVGWDTRGALLYYYEANRFAVERGVTITRIFVIRRLSLQEADLQRVVRTQLQDKIDVRIAFIEALPVTGDFGDWINNCIFDFAIYDDRVVAERTGESGNCFGKKTSVSSEVNNYLRLFELIERHAHRVIFEEGRIVIPGIVEDSSRLTSTDIFLKG